MSSSVSSRSSINRDFYRTPSPRFFQRVDESEEFNLINDNGDDDRLTSTSHLTSSTSERNQDNEDNLIYNETRRALNFSDDDKSIGSKSRRIPRHSFPTIAMTRGVFVGPKFDDIADKQERDRQAKLDAIVDSRTISTSSKVDSFLFSGSDATTIVVRPTRKRMSVTFEVLESEFGRMNKRVSTNSVLQCASCCGQHLVDADDKSRTCVFCDHSVLDEIDVNVPECQDDF